MTNDSQTPPGPPHQHTEVVNAGQYQYSVRVHNGQGGMDVQGFDLVVVP